VAVVFHKVLQQYSLTATLPTVLKDITLVLFTGITYRFILSNENQKNKVVLEKNY
jgi:hypothetical protein